MVLMYLSGRSWGYFWWAFFFCAPSWSSVPHTWNTLLSMALSLNVAVWSCLLSLRNNEKTVSLHTWWSIKRGTVSQKMWKLDPVEARGSSHCDAVWMGWYVQPCLSSQPVYCLFSLYLTTHVEDTEVYCLYLFLTSHGIVWYRWPVSALTVALSHHSSQCWLNRVLRTLRGVGRIDIVVTQAVFTCSHTWVLWLQRHNHYWVILDVFTVLLLLL